MITEYGKLFKKIKYYILIEQREFFLPAYVSDIDDDLSLLKLCIPNGRKRRDFRTKHYIHMHVTFVCWYSIAIWARLFGHFSEPAARYSARIAMRHSLCAAV